MFRSESLKDRKDQAMKTMIPILVALMVGCAPGGAPGMAPVCPEESPEGEIVVGVDPVFREDAEGFCRNLDGTLAGAGRLQDVMVAFREMADPDSHGWVRETTLIGGRRSRYTIGWNGFLTPTIDPLAVAIPVCVVP